MQKKIKNIFKKFYINFHFTGVLSSYKGCISRVQLYGPTNFAPTVNHVASIARQFKDGSQYFILLIITDGIITDMPQTRKVGTILHFYGPVLILQNTVKLFVSHDLF